MFVPLQPNPVEVGYNPSSRVPLLGDSVAGGKLRTFGESLSKISKHNLGYEKNQKQLKGKLILLSSTP